MSAIKRPTDLAATTPAEVTDDLKTLLDDGDMTADGNTTAATDQPAPARRRLSLRPLIMAALGLAGLAAGGWYANNWWTEGRFMISTDDAYVTASITTISPKVSGYVARIEVAENKRVRAGDALITLDDGDYRIARDAARASISSQELTLRRIDAQIAGAGAGEAQARAQVKAAQATLTNAAAARDRIMSLQQSGSASRAARDSAETAYKQADASLAAARAGLQSATAAITVLQAQRAEAASALTSLSLAADKAERDLGFTVLRAPYDGIVGNLAIHTGDLVAAGQRLAALVPVDALYVEANFKETQLAGIVPGETVRISVDALGGETIDGTVVSISPASGSVFSLLPANNATGNFTKVVQRVPVRIALPQTVLDAGGLQAGLSVVVDIDSRTAPDDRLKVASSN